MISFILGVLVTIAIFFLCLWAMKPEEFKALMRSIGGGGIKPPINNNPKDKEDIKKND